MTPRRNRQSNPLLRQCEKFVLWLSGVLIIAMGSILIVSGYRVYEAQKYLAKYQTISLKMPKEISPPQPTLVEQKIARHLREASEWLVNAESEVKQITTNLRNRR